MDDQAFDARMDDLRRTLDTLPEPHRDRLLRLVEETFRRHEAIKQAIAQRSEHLDTLRLTMNYLLFDLEATKRENAELKCELNRLTDRGGANADGTGD